MKTILMLITAALLIGGCKPSEAKEQLLLKEVHAAAERSSYARHCADRDGAPPSAAMDYAESLRHLNEVTQATIAAGVDAEQVAARAAAGSFAGTDRWRLFERELDAIGNY